MEGDRATFSPAECGWMTPPVSAQSATALPGYWSGAGLTSRGSTCCHLTASLAPSSTSRV